MIRIMENQDDSGGDRMEIHELCPGCMGRVTEQQIQYGCPYCGYRLPVSGENAAHILAPRTVLQGKYMIGRMLGAGGCGITYLGYDLNLEMRIAIKEYYPAGFVSRDITKSNELLAGEGDKGTFFSDGKKKYIQEARMLARFAGLRNIVSVRDYFEGNNTCYIIMEYLDGETLKSYLERRGGRLSSSELMRMLQPLLSALNEIHSQGLIHRDISPDNIMILKDGTLKLLDFGSARDMAGSAERSASVMLKPGYAPEEQYRMYGEQGSWTDVYALCATIYRCLTGHTPVDAMSRKELDTLIPPSRYGAALTPVQEAALLKGMAVDAGQRYRTVGEFYRGFYCNEIPMAQPVQSGGAQWNAVGQNAPQGNASGQNAAQWNVQGKNMQQWNAPGQDAAPWNGQGQDQQMTAYSQSGTPQGTYRMGSGMPYQMPERKKKSPALIVAVSLAAAAAVVLISLLFLLVRNQRGGEDQAWSQEELARGEDSGNQAGSGDPVTDGGQDHDQDDSQNGLTLPNGLTQSVQDGQQADDSMRGLSQNPGDGRTQQNGELKLCYDIPEGFKEMSTGLFCAPDYPNDAANINILTAGNDQQTFRYTKESYCEAVKYLYEEAYGYDVVVNCTEFTRSELNGCKTLIVRMSYELLGMEIEQIQFAAEVGTNRVTTITMSQPAGGGWLDAFERVLDSIRFE